MSIALIAGLDVVLISGDIPHGLGLRGLEVDVGNFHSRVGYEDFSEGVRDVLKICSCAKGGGAGVPTPGFCAGHGIGAPDSTIRVYLRAEDGKEFP